MLETSSLPLRLSSEIFDNLRKMLENVRLAFGTILDNLRTVEIFGKSPREKRGY